MKVAFQHIHHLFSGLHFEMFSVGFSEMENTCFIMGNGMCILMPLRICFFVKSELVKVTLPLQP